MKMEAVEVLKFLKALEALEAFEKEKREKNETQLIDAFSAWCMLSLFQRFYWSFLLLHYLKLLEVQITNPCHSKLMKNN